MNYDWREGREQCSAGRVAGWQGGRVGYSIALGRAGQGRATGLSAHALAASLCSVLQEAAHNTTQSTAPPFRGSRAAPICCSEEKLPDSY